MEKSIIVITGGTSGLGLELVKQSIKKGFLYVIFLGIKKK